MESNLRGFKSESGTLKANSSSRPVTRSGNANESSRPLSNSESSSPIFSGWVVTLFKTFSNRSRMDTLSPEQGRLQGMKHNVGVQRRRKILDVVTVELQLLDGILGRAAVLLIDLRPSGDARFHAQTLTVVGDFLLQHRGEFRPLRARPDDGHFAAHHVEQLRQLVETQPAQPFSRGAEFENGKQLAVQSGASLAVNHRTVGSKL